MKNKIIRTAAIFSFLFLLWSVGFQTKVSANIYYGLYPRGEFGNFMAQVVKSNLGLDFRRMKPGDAYRLPDGTIDQLEAGDTRGIWGRQEKKWIERYSSTEDPKPAVASAAKKAVIIGGITTKPWWYNFIPWLIGPGVVTFFTLLFYFDFLPFSRRLQKEEENEEIEEELTKDPITSGPPFVEGGILPAQIELLENFFNKQAKTLGSHPVRISPIESGLIHGTGKVGYLDGTQKTCRIEKPGLAGYRAKFRFDDKTEKYLCTLRGCMNPVEYGSGEVFSGFEFTPTEVESESKPETTTTTSEKQIRNFSYPIMEFTKELELVEDSEEYDQSYGNFRLGSQHRARRFHKSGGGKYYFD